MPRTRKVAPTSQMDAELALLYDIGNLVQNSPPCRATFEELLKLVGREIDFRAASLYILSPETGKLEEAASVGRTVDLIGFVKFEMGMGFSAWVAKERRPIMLNNLRKSIGGTDIRSFLSVPMVLQDELVGVFNLAHDQPDSFTERDLHLSGIIAIEIGVSVERMIFESRLAKKEDELRDSREMLKSIKAHYSELERKQTQADSYFVINDEISNLLAIIAGNAQFLIMTMKNSHPSILKRLRAIDDAATSIAQMNERAQSVLSPSAAKGDNRAEIRNNPKLKNLVKIGQDR